MERWNKDQVREWARAIEGVEDKAADALFEQDITGPSLMLLDTDDLKKIGVTLGPAKLILHERDKTDKLQKEGLKTSGDRSGTTCKPYPFNKYHDTYRYVEGDILDVPESGGSNLIEPCHEYKAFTNTTEETEMTKFAYETVRFAAACMNSRTNGTIHFGIGDLPDFTHGQVLGVAVDRDREAFNKTLRTAIDESFAFKDKTTAQKCIKPPRFVSVLNKNITTSEKFVIEVDVIPDSSLCQDKKFHTFGCNKKKKDREKEFLIRESGGSKDLLPKNTDNAKAMAEYERFISTEMPKLIQLRKQSEEDHLRKVKNYKQGSKLCQMITGGTGSLDKSYYEHCIIVTNKSHPGQLDLVDFLVELNPVAVLDFDPQSLTNGLYECFEKKSTVNIHSPEMYNIKDSVFDTATELQLTKSTSWVFCNGGSEDEPPSEIDHWVTEKGASVRNVVSFLCRKDVLRNKKFLVVFLLFSRVHDKMDPLVETFCTFYQELKGAEQILCICDNEQSFTSWKNLIDCRYEVDISNRCIYELSFSEVNGTILSLLSENRRSSRFLPGAGGSKVALEKKVERQLNTLDVLCINQCEGGNEDRVTIEENFYRGGQVSWWNFYFSQDSFIKRDKFEYITNTVIPELCSLRKACVRFNLLHLPGCGGTTLAKHILWTHRARFRCALLINSDADPDTVAKHVAILLKFGCTEDKPPVPVLLMIDDFEDMEKVIHLQQRIEEQWSNMKSRSPLVILLNCMRSEYSPGPSDPTEDTVLILNKLTEHELQQFNDKRKEMEQTFNPSQIDTFYGFMLMKENFNPEYFKRVVQHTFKSFDMDQKHAQLTAVLVLLSVYCKHAALSVSLCEQYLCCEQPFNGDKDVEEGFQTFSTLIWSCDVRGNVAFKGVRMIHSLIAQHCLTELNLTHKLSKADITNFLLTKNELYENTQGKDKLMWDIHFVLVKRYSLEQEFKSQPSVLATSTQQNPGICVEQNSKLQDSEDKKADFRFSPLLRDIEHETPGFGEDALLHASERFKKDPFVSQVIARYYYLKKKDFKEAKRWAKKSKELLPNNSYICDTMAQVIKHELKHYIANEKQQFTDAKVLHRLLELAKSAVDAFRETRKIALDESTQRLQTKRHYKPLNVSGFLGEIQTCVLIIEVLEKTPLFSGDEVRHDILFSLLSGSISLDQLKEKDPKDNNIPFYDVLKKIDMLRNIKDMMKSKFDFFDKFNVNLSSKFGMKESRDQIVQSELSRCFGKFAQLFCQTESEHVLNNSMLKLHKARQLIEKEKVDSYSGILNCLSRTIEPDVLKEIINAYKLIHNSKDCSPVEKVNYIYINVALSCISLKWIEEPFHTLVNILLSCLEHPPRNTHLPLYFIAVILLWPQPSHPKSEQLRSYITHMKTAFHSEMKQIYNGKKATVHFFLGKKPDYGRIVHLGEIKRCVSAGHEQFASMWENGVIWKKPKVQELLCRVTGKVKDRNILAHTCISDFNVEVKPLFQSQLRGHREGSIVSFFIGFSMQGPFAIDINDQLSKSTVM